MRKTITVPAEGETLNIGLTGRSFIIEQIAVFETPADVPLISTSLGGNFPAYPRNVYSESGQRFNDLVITGTAAAAGADLTIFVTDECLDTQFNIVLSEQYKSVPGTTFTKVANDVAQSLSELDLVDADGNLPTKLVVGVSPTAGASGGGIRWAINADPVQGNDTLGNVLTVEMGTYEIIDISYILAFRFIAEFNLEPVTVNFTPEY